MDKKITQEYLKECLHYEPETGIFTWKERPLHHFKKTNSRTNIQIMNIWNGRNAHNIANSRSVQGYIKIFLDGKSYMAHRLAWLYMEGYFPEYEIDHINRIRHDNKWNNLRHVTTTCNMQNKNVSKNNKTGVNGVTYDTNTNKWRSRITVNKKVISLGRFNNFNEAVKARYEEENNNQNWKCSSKSSAYLYLKENNLL